MLTPEDAEKVLIKNLANVIRKVHTSKPLTAAERALVAEAAAGGPLLAIHGEPLRGSGQKPCCEWLVEPTQLMGKAQA